MIKLSANLSTMFTELPFPARFEAAAKSGFKGVEFWFPYQYDLAELAKEIKKHSLEVALHNFPPGNWEAGDRGTACIPGREVEFRENTRLAIKYAVGLGCRRLHCMVGIAPKNLPEERIHQTLVANLRSAAEAAGKEGILLLIEAINTNSFPGFAVIHSRDAFRLIDEVGNDNLRFLYDTFHLQVMEGNLTNTIRENLGRIGHIQIADNPGRHEPGTGEINFPNLLRFIDEAGYKGWVGCEYLPSTTTGDSLKWAAPYLKG